MPVRENRAPNSFGRSNLFRERSYGKICTPIDLENALGSTPLYLDTKSKQNLFCSPPASATKERDMADKETPFDEHPSISTHTQISLHNKANLTLFEDEFALILVHTYEETRTSFLYAKKL